VMRGTRSILRCPSYFPEEAGGSKFKFKAGTDFNTSESQNSPGSAGHSLRRLRKMVSYG
jgi:hypothetical protein